MADANEQAMQQDDAHDELTDFLRQLLTRVPGLTGALLSDREGVSILAGRVVLATTNSDKLGAGKTEQVTSFWDGKVLVQFDLDPLVVTLIGSADVNVGLISSMREEIFQNVDYLRNTLDFDPVE